MPGTRRGAERRPAGTAQLRRPERALAVGIVLVLAATWTWWAIRSGAYFPAVFHPGAALLAALLAVLAVAAPWPARLCGGPAVAAGALVGLAIWTAASALWSPTPDTALEDAQRVVAYAAAFAIGIWVCLLLGRRLVLSLLPPALAAAAVGMVVVVTILVGDDPSRVLDEERTLDFPLGYRNANAGFLLIGSLASLALAAREAAGPAVRMAATGSASLGIQVAVLSQSRSSALALSVAVVVLLFAARSPARAALVTVAAAVPAAAALPWLLEPFAAGSVAGAAGPLRDAAVAIVFATLAAAFLGGGTIIFERALGALGRHSRRMPSRRVLAGGLAAVLAATAVVLFAAGDLEDRIAGFGGGETPSFTERGTRFSLDAGSNRRDFWRVAVQAAADRPVLGQGGGGFHFAYLRDRSSAATPHDPHSVELLMLSELGALGLLLFAVVVVAVVVGVLRARRLGPAATNLAAGALAAGAYWLAAASLDWFWAYPALTAPVLALLGAAVAPALRHPAAGGPSPARIALALVAAAFALSVVPPYLSARWTEDAYDGWRDDLPSAYADLGRARDANPLADEPLLAEGVIARESGDDARARAAFEEAVRLEPRNWAAHYFLGRLLIGDDRGRAISVLERASVLNPDDEATARTLARARRSSSR